MPDFLGFSPPVPLPLQGKGLGVRSAAPAPLSPVCHASRIEAIARSAPSIFFYRASTPLALRLSGFASRQRERGQNQSASDQTKPNNPVFMRPTSSGSPSLKGRGARLGPCERTAARRPFASIEPDPRPSFRFPSPEGRGVRGEVANRATILQTAYNLPEVISNANLRLNLPRL